jgi:predicted HNH restriction endonuclease
MSKASDKVKKHRAVIKAKIVKGFGSCCSGCGYDRCHDALEFHHLDPDEKEFSLKKARANNYSWARMVEELKKCIMLCGNCHAEVHAGTRQLTGNEVRFDASIVG